MPKVFVVFDDELGVRGICNSLESAQKHIAFLKNYGFACNFTIDQYRVIEN